MRAVHVVGRRNHGKTLLITELLRELGRRGVRAATWKNSSHEHELDTPGKDSHRHREAGASPVVVATPALLAVYVSREPGDRPYEILRGLLGAVDLLVIEGDIDGPGPKVEVWREALGTTPLAAQRDGIAAVITDDEIPQAVTMSGGLAAKLPVWPRANIPRLADELLALAAEI